MDRFYREKYDTGVKEALDTHARLKGEFEWTEPECEMTVKPRHLDRLSGQVSQIYTLADGAAEVLRDLNLRLFGSEPTKGAPNETTSPEVMGELDELSSALLATERRVAEVLAMIERLSGEL